MRKIGWLLALSGSLLALATPPALAQTSAAQTATASAKDALTKSIDAVIDQAIAEQRIVGAVVIVMQDGEVRYRRAAGFADREAGTAMRLDTVFRLASMSKPLVTAAAMRLIEDGKLGFNDPVKHWLPDFRPKLADGSAPVITIRQLLTHTSGLGYGFGEGRDGPYRRLDISDGLDHPNMTLDENLRRLGQAPLLHAPGSTWTYSLSTDVLGAVIEEVTGERLPVAVDRLVLRPLEMHNTGFFARDPSRLAVPYADGELQPVRMRDGQRVPLDKGFAVFSPNRALDPRAYPSGGAGMVGTADDFARFLEAIRTGGAPILEPTTVATMMRDQVGVAAETQGPGWGFGYGWAVLDDPTAATTPQARGTIQWGGAYGHSWFVDPMRRLTVVALTDTAFEGMSGQFPADLRDAIYAGLAVDEPAGAH